MHTKKTLVIKNADLLVTMDDRRREIRGGCMLVEGCRIVAVGGSELLAAGADEAGSARARGDRGWSTPITICSRP